MTESRYPTRVSDPDDTTRIPKEALEGLRDADQAWEAGRPPNEPGAQPARDSVPGPAAAGAAAPKPSNGLSSAPASGRLSGYPSDGSPAVPPGGTGRAPLFGAAGGAGANGSGGFRSEPSPPVAPASMPPAVPSPAGYPERSQTGYSPAAYQGTYSSAYPSLAETPTTVAGRGVGTAGAGQGAAGRPPLGTPARPSPVARGAGGSRPPRRARLLVRHIDPWSTLKFSFVLSVAMFFVWLVAVGVLYGVLDGMGVFEQINGLYDEVSGNAGDRLLSPGLVLGSATVVGAVNIVLFTALATIGAFVYNICSDLVGGIEVTLAERD